MKNKWTKIEKGNPDRSGQYLVSDSAGNCTVGYWVSSAGKFVVSSHFWKDSDIIAWSSFEVFIVSDEQVLEKTMEGLL